MHEQSCCFANLNLLFLTVTAKKFTKKRDARAELLFCQSKSIIFYCNGKEMYKKA